MYPRPWQERRWSKTRLEQPTSGQFMCPKQKKYDKSLVESWKSDMEGLLIFAALFSAILTAFLIESYKSLNADSGDLTVHMLVQISQQLAAISNGSAFDIPPFPSFKASTPSVTCNALWFISLGLSLACALIATFVQQWARDFLHKTDMRSAPIIRARIFSYLYYGLKRFRMHTVVEIIPLLLHMSLVLFFCGLVAFLIPVDLSMAIIAAIILAIVTVVYGTVTLFPLQYLDCPYQTPLSGVLWSAVPYFRSFKVKQHSDPDVPKAPYSWSSEIKENSPNVLEEDPLPEEISSSNVLEAGALADESSVKSLHRQNSKLGFRNLWGAVSYFQTSKVKEDSPNVLEEGPSPEETSAQLLHRQNDKLGFQKFWGAVSYFWASKVKGHSSNVLEPDTLSNENSVELSHKQDGKVTSLKLHDETMVEAMAHAAMKSSEEHSARDYKALVWTMNSLTDDRELEPFIEAIPDLLWQSTYQSRYEDHIRGLIHNPEVRLLDRIHGFLFNCYTGVLSSDVSQRRTIVTYKALWAIASLCDKPSWMTNTSPIDLSGMYGQMYHVSQTSHPVSSYSVSAMTMILWSMFCMLKNDLLKAQAHLANEFNDEDILKLNRISDLLQLLLVKIEHFSKP
ncbi:hypothetical protein MSAN_00969100 [Mycena sanguinolenta]|uniref:DUF6535 domain-containing protein n=1 Tax=Mycena sanguinolenta TaxID=230812 RepID=A0A8H6YYE8_9AGAR|nr:hypothetical protein MSAN_00969100 [Mycena sanguinolenta]